MKGDLLLAGEDIGKGMIFETQAVCSHGVFIGMVMHIQCGKCWSNNVILEDNNVCFELLGFISYFLFIVLDVQ